MTEPATPAEGSAQEMPYSVHRDGDAVAWCGPCRALYNPRARTQLSCPRCGTVASPSNVPSNVEALYRAHAPSLLRYVRRLIRDWGLSDAVVDAEGVVNDVFLAMIQQIRRTPAYTIGNPTAWLFVVGRRQVGRAARRRLLLADGDPQNHVELGIAVTWSSQAPLPTANQLRGTRIALRAIADLPDRQKVAFYLRKIEEWSLDEIGDYLDCAASTAGVHVHRGNAALQRILSDSWEPDGVQHLLSRRISRRPPQARRLPSLPHAPAYEEPHSYEEPHLVSNRANRTATRGAVNVGGVTAVLGVGIATWLTVSYAVPWWLTAVMAVGAPLLIGGGLTAASMAVGRGIRDGYAARRAFRRRDR